MSTKDREHTQEAGQVAAAHSSQSYLDFLIESYLPKDGDSSTVVQQQERGIDVAMQRDDAPEGEVRSSFSKMSFDQGLEDKFRKSSTSSKMSFDALVEQVLSKDGSSVVASERGTLDVAISREASETKPLSSLSITSQEVLSLWSKMSLEGLSEIIDSDALMEQILSKESSSAVIRKRGTEDVALSREAAKREPASTMGIASQSPGGFQGGDMGQLCRANRAEG